MAEQPLLYGDMKDLSDLDPKLLKQIETFFVNYQKMRDAEFKILARQGAHQAVNIVKRTKNWRAA